MSEAERESILVAPFTKSYLTNDFRNWLKSVRTHMINIKEGKSWKCFR